MPPIRPWDIATPYRRTSGSSTETTADLPSSNPTLSLFHPYLWGLPWKGLRGAPPAAVTNAPYHCASVQVKGAHTAPSLSPAKFTFGTPVLSSGYCAAPSSFIFPPSFTLTFPDPSTMAAGDIHRTGDITQPTQPSHARHVRSPGALNRKEEFDMYIKNILHNRAPDAPPVRTIRRYKVRTTPRQSSLTVAVPTEAPIRTSPPSAAPIPPICQGKKNYVKFLWRCGDIPKSAYTDYCAQLNSLHHDYLRGDLNSNQLQAQNGELLDGIQRLRSSSSSSPTLSSHSYGNQASPPKMTLHLVPPPSSTAHRRLHTAAFGLQNNYGKKRRWRRKENRVIPGGNNLLRKLATCWFYSFSGDELLNRKRPAESIALEAARIPQTTQRLIPEKKGKGSLEE